MALGRKTGGREKGTLNKATAEIKAAFRKHGDDLVAALLKLTKSDDERVRLGAIQAALDRGWGKPTQAVDMTVSEPITKIEHVIVNALPAQVIEGEAVEVMPTDGSESKAVALDTKGKLTR